MEIAFTKCYSMYSKMYAVHTDHDSIALVTKFNKITFFWTNFVVVLIVFYHSGKAQITAFCSVSSTTMIVSIDPIL